MRYVKLPMHRYGEADFDEDYVTWGLHDRETQIKEAESVLRLLGGDISYKILDLACGIGTHAIYWAKRGHNVTGVDISETFIAKAKEQAGKEGANVQFTVCDILKFDMPPQVDVVTWIESSLLDKDIAKRIYRSLDKGSRFISDVRNPEHPKVKARSGDWRYWREDKGVFTLERHELNPETGKHEDVWITIDPAKETIEEKVNIGEPGLKSLDKTTAFLKDVGFSSCTFHTMEGEPFNGGNEPYWLWIVAEK